MAAGMSGSPPSGCSDRMIRRLKAWAVAGIGEQVHALALAAYDQMIGLDLADVAVDGCITKAPCGRGLRRARSRWTGAKAA